jgi:TRAP transporter TAXI family solute receptor
MVHLRTSRRVWLVLLASLLLALTAGCDIIDKFKKASGGDETEEEEDEGPTILTGSKKGNYYKAASELNEVLGEKLELEVKTSSGSFENLKELGQNKADYAIVQLDTLIMFLRMGDPHKRWANNALGVAALSNEYVHIIVNKKANIKTIGDLKNKRIAAGSDTSGSFVSAFTVMAYFNDVNLQKVQNTSTETYEVSLAKLQKGELDALFLTTAPGMPLLKQVAAGASKTIEILDVGSAVKLPKGIEYTYAVEKLPKGTYAWQDKEVHVLATPGFLFANAKISSTKVRKVAKKIYSKAGKLKKKSGLWKLVSKARAKKDMEFGIGFHPGAKAYLGGGK